MDASVLPLARASAADWLELTKPRITLMVVFTALVGFVTATSASPWTGLLLAALAGTGLVAGGASALNQVLERDTDALMHRTRTRPIPAGRIRPGEAILFGALLTLAGLGLLAALAGTLAALVAFSTWASYLFLYTPLKRRSHLVDARRRGSGCLAARDRLGRRQRQPRARGLHPVRHHVPVADPALPGDRLALPRRLRARGPEGASGHRPRGEADGAAGGPAQRGAPGREPGPGRRAASAARSTWPGRSCWEWASRSPRCSSRACAASAPPATCSWPRCSTCRRSRRCCSWPTSDRPRPAGPQRGAQRHLRLPADARLLAHPSRPARGAPPHDARGDRRLGAVPDVLPRLPLPGGLGAVHRPGPRARGLLRGAPQPHDPGGRDRAARPRHAVARPAQAASTPTAGSPAGRCRCGSTCR